MADQQINVAFLLYSMTGGGAERVAATLISHFPEKFSIHLVLINGPVEYPLPEHIPVTMLRKHQPQRWRRIMSLPGVRRRYINFCRQNKIQISLSFDEIPNFINASLPGKPNCGAIKILTVHNPPSVRYGTNTLSHRIHRQLIQRFYPRADKIICVSKGIKYDVEKYLQQHHQETVYIYNPIPVAEIRQATSVSHTPPDNPFVFLHVGNFRVQKNHSLLIRAFEYAAIKGAELWLMGNGPLLEKIQLQVRNSSVADQIRFVGFDSNPYTIMHKAHCLVLTSFYEGLPMVILEAMACGLPVISTDCPFGPREILSPATSITDTPTDQIEITEYGILTPTGDMEKFATALRLLFNDRHLYEKIKQPVLRRASEFDASLICDEYIRIFESEIRKAHI